MTQTLRARTLVPAFILSAVVVLTIILSWSNPQPTLDLWHYRMASGSPSHHLPSSDQSFLKPRSPTPVPRYRRFGISSRDALAEPSAEARYRRGGISSREAAPRRYRRLGISSRSYEDFAHSVHTLYKRITSTYEDLMSTKCYLGKGWMLRERGASKDSNVDAVMAGEVSELKERDDSSWFGQDIGRGLGGEEEVQTAQRGERKGFSS